MHFFKGDLYNENSPTKKANKEQIESAKLERLPQGWFSMMGFQFENLVVSNGPSVCRLLGIPPEDILVAGPFVQKAGARQKGCQVDYLIQTRFRNFFVCEVKFKQDVIGKEVIHEMEEKLASLKYPKGFSCRPVLIHVNGVSEEVVDSGFFASIVDFSDLLAEGV